MHLSFAGSGQDTTNKTARYSYNPRVQSKFVNDFRRQHAQNSGNSLKRRVSIFGSKLNPKNLHLGSKLPRLSRVTSIKVILSAAVIIGVAGGIGYWAYQNKIWMVKQVQIQGEMSVLQDRVAAAAGGLKGENLLTLNAGKVADDLKQDPYVQDVYIEKQYPGKIVINVKEAKPFINLYTMNEAYLFDTRGKILTTTRLEENYPISEVERLVYLNDQPFRSDALKDKWLVENLSKQREQYLQELADKAKQGTTAQAEVKTTVTKNKNNEKEIGGKNDEDFDKYVQANFDKVDLNSLNKYYVQLRAEVKTTIENRWSKLEEKVPAQDNQIIVYSLIEYADLKNSENLFAKGFLDELNESLGKQYIVDQIVIVSPVSVQVNVHKGSTTTNSGISNAKVIRFTNRKQLQQQLWELDAITTELKDKEDKISKIDLTGDKVVVQYR